MGGLAPPPPPPPPHPILGASGARDSAGAVLGKVARARVVLRHVPMVLETVQAQFLDKVARARVVLRHVPMVLETVADPVSSGKYSGTLVFTAPAVEPAAMSFAVPLNGCTIVATATVVTSYSSSADCPYSAAPMCCGSICVAMSCGGWFFTPDGAYDSYGTV